jgi:hypothetical protein
VIDYATKDEAVVEAKRIAAEMLAAETPEQVFDIWQKFGDYGREYDIWQGHILATVTTIMAKANPYRSQA